MARPNTQKLANPNDISPLTKPLCIEMWDIDRPKDYPKNARKWSGQAIEKVGSSIREYGWRQPVVVDKEGVIVIGHLRRRAGKSIGMTQCPVHVAADLSPAQIRGLRLADNRTNQESDWDVDLLTQEFAELKTLEFDLTLTGFNSHEIDAFLLNPDADDAANECPDVPEHPVTIPGDMWRLGGHLVLCGDSTAPDSVSRLLGAASGGLSPFLMVTDPPYGVEYDPEWRQESGLQDRTRQSGKVANDDRADWTEAYRLFPGSVAYVWHANLRAIEVGTSIQACGFQIRSIIIWAKQALQISRGHYHWQHEPCWYAIRKGKTAHWHGDRKQSTLWQVPNLNGNGNRDEAATGHGTQKPVELMRRPILNHTQRGDAVYDPFLGSGTTLIAADMTERVCFGLELEPAYVDVICLRYMQLTGNPVVLADGPYKGNTYEKVKIGRQAQAQDLIKDEILTGVSDA